MSPQLRAVEQTAFDEQVIDDPDVEAALEEREKRKSSLQAVRKVYDGAHEAAMAEIAKLELPEGGQHGWVGSGSRALPSPHVR